MILSKSTNTAWAYLYIHRKHPVIQKLIKARENICKFRQKVKQIKDKL